MMQVCQARRDCVCHPYDSRRDVPIARLMLVVEARRDVHKTIRTLTRLCVLYD